jgi:hypothetical protein
MMLVCDVELMKCGKIVIRWPVSLVGLHLIKASSYRLRNPRLDLWKLAVSLVHLDREAGAPGSLRRHVSRGEHQLAGEIVESRAEIVDNVSGDRADVGAYPWDGVKPEDMLPALVVAVVDDGLSAPRR